MLESNETKNWLKELIDNYQQNKNFDVKNVCQSLTNKEITIEAIVSDLRELLTNKVIEERIKGLLILSSVVHSLPQNFLLKAEVNHLAIFYCDRLKDHYTIIPYVFDALFDIINCTNYPQDISNIIFNTIVKETTVQQYGVSERFAVFRILALFFENHFEELKKLNAELVYGFIQIIEGERDPRCLLMVFRLTAVILENINLGPFCEDLFEVISCYFPITFSPPADDEYGITNEDLSDALMHCFKLCPDFSEYIFPLLIEKLESELVSAKIDSYKVIGMCCHTYGWEKIKNHTSALWTSIRIDILKPNNLNDEVIDYALKALTSLSDALSANLAIIDEFVENIWKDILPSFLKPELELMNAAISIIIASISSNIYIYDKIGDQLMPILLQQFTFIQRESHRIDIIHSLSRIFKHSLTLPNRVNDVKYIDSLFVLLTSLTIAESESESLRVEAISCVNQLIHSLKQITLEYWKSLSDILRSLLFNHLNSDLILNSSYTLLETFGLQNPNLAYSSIVEPLINDLDINHLSKSIHGKFMISLNCIERVSSNFTIFKKINSHLLDEIKSNSYVIEEIENVQEIYSQKLMDSYSICIDKHKNSENNFIFAECLDPLIQHCIHVAFCTDNKNSANINTKLMNKLFYLIGNGISHLNYKYSQQLYTRLLQFFNFGRIDQMLVVVPPSCYCSFVSEPNFLKFLNGEQALIIIGLIHSILCNLNLYDFSVDIELLDKLSYHAINNEYNNSQICDLSSQTIAALINKFDDQNESINSKLIQLKVILEEIINDNKESEQRKCLSLSLITWITKALVLSGNRFRSQFVDVLIKGLDHENNAINTSSSLAFSAIHKTESNLLNKNSNAKNKLFYNQSFFIETYEPLLSKYMTANINQIQKQNYLTALLSQLTHIPKAVFRNELKKLLPMLLDAISNENNATNQIASLEAITQIIGDNKALLMPSLKTTINNCVQMSRYSEHMRVRGSALNCLARIARAFDENQLISFRDDVIRSLRPVLNDRKRVVRHNAVEARCLWIFVGQPGT